MVEVGGVLRGKLEKAKTALKRLLVDIMDTKDNSDKGSVKEKESWRESFCFCREYVNNYEQNVSGDVDIKTHSGEI